MRHIYSLAILTAVCLVMGGCAATVDPAADTIDLQLSEPTGGANVSLVRFDSANDWQRQRNVAALNVFAGQTPGPVGLTTRSVRCVVANAIPNSDYSMAPDSVNYVELSETTSLGTRSWRSESGLLHLGSDNSKESVFTLTNVIMAPRSGNATGKFKIAGPVIIRF